MKLLSKQMPASFNLFLFGDVHLGTILSAEEAIRQFIETVLAEYEGIPARHNYLIDHGDAIEAIKVDDVRYDARVVTDPRGTPFLQAKDYVSLMWPVRKQMLMRLKGNHELYLDRFGDLSQHICDELGVPYGTYTARMTYEDAKGNRLFKSFHTHGRKSITSTADDPKRRKTNMELILKRHLKHKAGDCLLMAKGHTHRLLICRPQPELYLTDDGREIEQQYTSSMATAGYIHPDHRWYVSTGSFYKLYADGQSSYAECYEYDPLEIGYAIVLVRDRQIQDVRRVIIESK